MLPRCVLWPLVSSSCSTTLEATRAWLCTQHPQTVMVGSGAWGAGALGLLMLQPSFRSRHSHCILCRRSPAIRPHCPPGPDPWRRERDIVLETLEPLPSISWAFCDSPALPMTPHGRHRDRSGDQSSPKSPCWRASKSLHLSPGLPGPFHSDLAVVIFVLGSLQSLLVQPPPTHHIPCHSPVPWPLLGKLDLPRAGSPLSWCFGLHYKVNPNRKSKNSKEPQQPSQSICCNVSGVSVSESVSVVPGVSIPGHYGRKAVPHSDSPTHQLLPSASYLLLTAAWVDQFLP